MPISAADLARIDLSDYLTPTNIVDVRGIVMPLTGQCSIAEIKACAKAGIGTVGFIKWVLFDLIVDAP